MSWASDNPELFDKLTTEALPEEWQIKVIEGEVKLEDVPHEILNKAMNEGMGNYFGDIADRMRDEAKERKMQISL